MRSLRFFAVVGVCSMLTSPQARAGTDINLAPDPNGPDIFASFINVSYSAGRSSAQFLATGFTSDFWRGPVDVGIVDSGQWTLSANINSSGFLSGGTVTAYGDVGGGAELLLRGDLIPGDGGASWGYQDASRSGQGSHDVFEFTYKVTGGSLQSDFLGFGGVGGVILNAGFGGGDQAFTGVWDQDFSSNASNGQSQTFVPEPSSYPLYASGILGLFVFFRRHRSKQFRSPTVN